MAAGLAALAAFLREGRAEILAAWEAAIAHRGSAASGESRALSDEISALLDRIAAHLEERPPSDAREATAALPLPADADERLIEALLAARAAVERTWPGVAEAGEAGGALLALRRELDGALAAAAHRLADAHDVLRAQLALSRARYEAVVENSPALIFSKDLAGRYLTINRRALGPLGLTPEAFLGNTDYDIFPREMADRMRAAELEVIARRAPVEREDVMSVRGAPRTYLSVKFPMLDDAGRVVGIAGVATDITDRLRWERAEELLAASGEILVSSFDIERTLAQVAERVVTLLADWTLVDVVEPDGEVRRLVAHRDPRRADLAAALRDTPIDPSRLHLAYPALHTRQRRLVARVPERFLDELSQTDEYRRLVAALAPTSLIEIPLVAHDRLHGAWLFARSDPVRPFDADDLDVATELGRRASLAIDNARLYEEAHRAIRSRDEILGTITHDLRNPLGAILVAAESLAERIAHADERACRAIALVVRAAQRMEKLVSELLDQQTIERGTLMVECAPCPAAELIRDAVELQVTRVDKADLALDVVAPDDLPPVLADRDRIQQVFDNLVGNAIKFAGAGGRISIGAAPADDEVRFWVSDTGPGIAPEDLPHVFDRYWKVQRADRRGAGLGLAIVKGIVEAHGGRVWVESAPGQGATFRFALPIAR